MQDFKLNLEPGNPDGHSVLRYLMEGRQMPLESAIDYVSQAVAKFAQEYRTDRGKLMTGMIMTGVFGFPIALPLGTPSIFIGLSMGASILRWQELGAMRDRLAPEYSVLKNSVLLVQFLRYLAQEIRERREQAFTAGVFQVDALTPANILTAYEHTIFAVSHGEHLENNASDPVLALFVLKLRQHTNQLPEWVISAFQQLEQAERQRANDVERASEYMWGNLEQRYPDKILHKIGPNTQLNAVDVPSASLEGEHRLGKPIEKALPLTRTIEEMLNTPLTLDAISQMPLGERAVAILNRLAVDGLDLSGCIQNQITCICGNQRGGKGTLMAILAILSSAIDPAVKVHYFTAGDDIYPFSCERLVCRLSYPSLDGDKADLRVAQALYQYLKEMDNATLGDYSNIILVIDEAVALSDYLDPEQKQWMIRFLLTRSNKKGSQTFIVLHGVNLTSWVGNGNTSGFSSTFKTGATFIGCEATSQKINPLRSISVATGRYFIANPDDFSKSVEGGDLGIVPQWLKTEINPATGQPDPARTLLNFFPEFISDVQARKTSPDSSIPSDKQAWDRLILESTDEQINELIEQRRSKAEKKDSGSREEESLLTIDEQIDYAVKLIREYFQEKKLSSDTARNIFNFKSKLKKVAKTLKDFNDLLEVAAEMKKINYFTDGNSHRVSLIQ